MLKDRPYCAVSAVVPLALLSVLHAYGPMTQKIGRLNGRSVGTTQNVTESGRSRVRSHFPGSSQREVCGVFMQGEIMQFLTQSNIISIASVYYTNTWV